MEIVSLRLGFDANKGIFTLPEMKRKSQDEMSQAIRNRKNKRYFWDFGLFSVEEAPHKRIHLHHLLISDLFIQTVNDLDSQQQTG
ncbi:MAG TPA: hypothetical protein O0X47_04345, partial [Methanocorpusculum sp.]|nr:hypothetical protein [Methanocorpusculum sp.]